jgi:hypothetical protein
LWKECTTQITVLRDVRFMETNIDTGGEPNVENMGPETAHYSHLLGFLTAQSILCLPNRDLWLGVMRNET